MRPQLASRKGHNHAIALLAEQAPNTPKNNAQNRQMSEVWHRYFRDTDILPWLRHRRPPLPLGKIRITYVTYVSNSISPAGSHVVK
jgi:hypothetical protein